MSQTSFSSEYPFEPALRQQVAHYLAKSQIEAVRNLLGDELFNTIAQSTLQQRQIQEINISQEDVIARMKAVCLKYKFEFTKELRGFAYKYKPVRILNAIGAIDEAYEEDRLRIPYLYFREAIIQGWRPNKSVSA